jgi:hypothetical protein
MKSYIFETIDKGNPSQNKPAIINCKEGYPAPPLGATPYYITIEKRIQELSGLIGRSKIPYDTDLIKAWAKEIILQCDLVKEMDKDYAKARCNMV